MLGLSNINHLTHRVENIFDAAHKDELPLNRQVVQVIFEAIDHLSAMVGVLRSEGHDEHDAGNVIDAIEKYCNPPVVNAKPPANPMPKRLWPI